MFRTIKCSIIRNSVQAALWYFIMHVYMNSSHSSHNKNQLDALNLLTPRCRVLPEQLTSLQLVKKFPAFHGTRRFITALTSVRHLSLFWASPIQSIYPHPT